MAQVARKPSNQKTAAEIYAQQNVIIHKAFGKCGMPYEENRETWLLLCRDIAGRPVEGLSEMNLAERRQLILHLQARCKGVRIYNPGVPKSVGKWRKGDPDAGYEVMDADDTQLRMIYALWTQLGYEPKQLRVMVGRRYQVAHEKWLKPDQLTACINYLKGRLEAKGEGLQAEYWKD